MNAAFYAAQIEDLASHGYVVLGIDHPYESLGVLYPAGRIARYSSRTVWKNFSPCSRPSSLMVYLIIASKTASGEWPCSP